MPRAVTPLFRLCRLVAAPLAATAAPAFAQKTDVVILINNDVFTCEIKRLEKGRLQASTDHLGTINIEWDKVKSVFSSRTFTVETSSGLRVYGNLAMNALGQLEVVTQAVPVALDLANVVYIAENGRSFWSRMDGSVDLGLSYTQSSGVAQANLNASASYENKLLRSTVSGSSYLTQDADDEDTSRHTAQLSVSRRFRQQGLLFVQGGFERNEELGFSLRSTATAGAGRFLVRSNRAQFAVGAGLSTNREKPLDGETVGNVDAFFTVRQSFFTYDSPKTDISTSFEVYEGLSQWGRVRLQLDSKIKREVVKDFTIGLTLYDSYDTDPPSADVRKNDVGFSLTIGWTF